MRLQMLQALRRTYSRHHLGKLAVVDLEDAQLGASVVNWVSSGAAVAEAVVAQASLAVTLGMGSASTELDILNAKAAEGLYQAGFAVLTSAV